MDRKTFCFGVYLGNYTVSSDAVQIEFESKFGRCVVGDPIKSKNLNQPPFGFAHFEKEEDAQACIAARRTLVEGVTITMNPAKERTFKSDANRGPGGRYESHPHQGVQTSKHTSMKLNDFDVYFKSSREASTGESIHVNVNLINGSHTATLSPLATTNTFKAILSHSCGPQELYIQDVTGDNPACYVKLHEELAEICPTAAVIDKPEPNKIYGALYSADESWYRCKVLDISSDKTQFKVHFIDYGNQEIVSKDALKKLPTSLTETPAAAVKYHMRDILPLPNCSQKVQDLISTWHEVVLECEVSSDGSVNLRTTDTNKTLRAALINSGLVTLTSISNPSRPSSTASSDAPGKQRGGQGRLSQQNTRQQHQGDSPVVVKELKRKKDELEKKLNEAQQELSSRRPIDDMVRELKDLMTTLRRLRKQQPLSEDGLLSRAITLATEADKPAERDSEETMQSSLKLHAEYLELQEAIKTAPSLADAEKLLPKRNELKKQLVQMAAGLKDNEEQQIQSEKKSQIAEILVELSEAYPESSKQQPQADLTELISRFNQWQESESSSMTSVMKATDEALAELANCYDTLKQALTFHTPSADDQQEDVMFQQQKLTQAALDLVKQEIAALQLENDSDSNEIVSSACSAVCVMLSDKLTSLDVVEVEMGGVQDLAEVLEPWVDVDVPAAMSKILELRKTLKGHKSSLRHRQADLVDLQENEEDASESETANMEKVIKDIQLQIHNTLLELEGEVADMAKLAAKVFPELLKKYPDLCFGDIEKGHQLYRPLRHITFYNTKDPAATVFAGKPVTLKTFTCQTCNEVPDNVQNLFDRYGNLNEHVQIDAFFFSKDGRDVHVQFSSKYAQVLDTLRELSAVTVDSLSAKLGDLNLEESDTSASGTDEDVVPAAELSVGAVSTSDNEAVEEESGTNIDIEVVKMEDDSC